MVVEVLVTWVMVLVVVMWVMVELGSTGGGGGWYWWWRWVVVVVRWIHADYRRAFRALETCVSAQCVGNRTAQRIKVTQVMQHACKVTGIIIIIMIPRALRRESCMLYSAYC